MENEGRKERGILRSGWNDRKHEYWGTEDGTRGREEKGNGKQRSE